MRGTEATKGTSAITNLAEQQGSTATETVKKTLMNPDERVRIEALHSALLSQMDLPLDIIKALAQHDVSA